MTESKQKISTLIRELHMTVVRTAPAMTVSDVIAALFNLSALTCIRNGLRREQVMHMFGCAFDHVSRQLPEGAN